MNRRELLKALVALNIVAVAPTGSGLEVIGEDAGLGSTSMTLRPCQLIVSDTAYFLGTVVYLHPSVIAKLTKQQKQQPKEAP